MLTCPKNCGSKKFRFYAECAVHVDENENTLSVSEPVGDSHMVVACDGCDYEGVYREFVSEAQSCES